jgi:hypothetical protein
MHKTILITPNQLEAGATIPQALDNQYVSNELYQEIIKKKTNLLDPIIKKKRSKEASNEFIRSLVYSSQVIVNRAFLTNNELLYKYYLPGNETDASSFASLLNQGVIVPYLFQEYQVFDNKEFDITDEGGLASEYLSQFVDNIKSVRFSKDDNVNNTQTNNLSFSFRNYFMGRHTLAQEQQISMLKELIAREQPIDREFQKEFQKHLKILSRYSEDFYEENGFLNRNDLYKKFIVAPNTNVADGVYLAKDSQNPFRHELKKLIDLKYNTNLPDALNRYSFTPSGMPTRSALQDDFQIADIDADKVHSFIEHDLPKLTKDRQLFIEKSQKAMYLPLLSELTISDVLEIRKLESWKDFIYKQSHILSNPLTIGDKYEEFQLAFETFQKEFSNWYYTKYPHNMIKKRCTSHASIVLNVGGEVITYDLNGTSLPYSDAKELPLLTKGVSIKLMMNVYNTDTNKLDKDRSYSLEVMRSEHEVKQNELYSIIQDTQGQKLPFVDSLVAEQDRN